MLDDRAVREIFGMFLPNGLLLCSLLLMLGCTRWALRFLLRALLETCWQRSSSTFHFSLDRALLSYFTCLLLSSSLQHLLFIFFFSDFPFLKFHFFSPCTSSKVVSLSLALCGRTGSGTSVTPALPFPGRRLLAY